MQHYMSKQENGAALADLAPVNCETQFGAIAQRAGESQICEPVRKRQASARKSNKRNSTINPAGDAWGPCTKGVAGFAHRKCFNRRKPYYQV